jgi:hypothetical protein
MWLNFAACVLNLCNWRRNIKEDRSRVAWTINFPVAALSAMATVSLWLPR